MVKGVSGAQRRRQRRISHWRSISEEELSQEFFRIVTVYCQEADRRAAKLFHKSMKGPAVFDVVDEVKARAKQLAVDAGTRAAQIVAPEIAALEAHCSVALARVFDARVRASDVNTTYQTKPKIRSK
jgi:hypothetical protein